jgi:hypothetical protein
LLWNTALTCASIFGIVYEPNPRSCVSQPKATWQYGLVGLTVEPTSPAPMPVFSSRKVVPHVARVSDVLSRAGAALEREAARAQTDCEVEAVEVLILLPVLVGECCEIVDLP